ncbi:MAG: PIG-L family deacetylase [Chloroflexota bacterium]|nr:PIG-L family deacetylase [Chloroflexota bacterium]
MKKRRLLISFAHPDDESFGLGAAIPKWIDDGVDVYLICATNGDVGTVPPHLQGVHQTVAELRLSELACARQYLDFKEVFLLGYRDSGMTGSETSRHPDSLCFQWEHDPERVTGHVAEVMRQIRPQVVVTFNRYGGYGHPDHIAIQRATEAAFHRLREDESPAACKPQKLYYAAFPTALLWARILTARLKGQDPRRMGMNQDIDVVKILDHVEPSHARIPIADYLDIWERASRCHASQGGGRITRTARWLRRILYSRQGFTRAFPKPNHSRADEDDLFHGVSL